MYKLAVLDDDQDWCVTVERFLRQDFSVVSYQSISSFFRQPQTLAQYDALLIDISLPMARHELSLDGIEVVSRLKQLLPQSPPDCAGDGLHE